MADKINPPEHAKGGNDKEAATRQGSSLLPSISVPKGGGAIRGIGEKFGVNPVTGTGSLSVPISASPGRSGFGPQLSLSYDSGSGNGPFGFGWSLSLPSITRKTDKGLPRYLDANESDEFILSGAEDLVPVFKKDLEGNWVHNPNGNLKFDEDSRDGYIVRRYRPRVEGLFARIERWTRQTDGDVHWRSISKDNILTVYGRDEESRIFDPTDNNRVFSWLICESYDDKGNAIIYKYKAENNEKIDWSSANETNRLLTANRYLKRIYYGNRKPLLLDITRPSYRKLHTEPIDFSSADWMFDLVFDYGEGHYETFKKIEPESEHHQFIKASASADGIWSIRPDPFSTYRAGFEVRTYRRCHRVLMFHHFPELKDEPYLVRSTEFDYADMPNLEEASIEAELAYKGSTRFASFIRAITQSGYVRDETKPVLELNGIKYLTYIQKSLPPLEFDYSQAIIQKQIGEFTIESLENLPQGLDGSIYQLVDLDGEGISGILTEQGVAWFYKPNLGEGKFGPMERVATKPSLALLSGGHQQLMDLAGDGQLDVVMLEGATPGFYERNHDQGWENFTSFSSLPNLFWKDPNLKFVDLTGDGHADVMITEDEAIIWHPSLAEEGFGPAERVHKALDEERGPRLVFDDGTQSIYLADMSGDGLVDLVRIRNGEVCYWPNLGYGNFGAKVTMDNAPWFDSPDQFDQKRIRLADIDGSSTTDITYLKHNSVEIYFNQSGNRLSDARKLSSFPQIDNLSSVQVADLFGNGTACLVWSSPLASDSMRPLRYIDLMGGNKPHLLISSKNNLGAETRVHYSASTKFYLEDKAEGNPWITKLPFPVHVVERVDTYDRISRNLFVARYAYHHGYFDGIEREFRGFGMVEQWDTAEIDIKPDEIEPDNTNWDVVSYVPPVLTRTWFHTGAYFEDGIISKHFEDEYYQEGDPSLQEGQLDPKQREAMLLFDTILPDNLTAEEAREACRSLKGSILRQEVYALDRRPDGTLTEESDRPYTVSERNYTIEHLQPMAENKHAVFFVHPRETIDFHYERKLYDLDAQNKNRADPRVTHNVTLEVDSYGNVLKSVALGYGRRMKDSQLFPSDQDKQSQLLITYTENRYTNPIPDPQNPQKLTIEELKKYDACRAPLQSETRTFEIVKFELDSSKLKGITTLFRFEELADLVNKEGFSKGEWDIPYEDIEHLKATGNNPYRRIIEHIRVLYRSNELKELLPLHSLESLALTGETYKLAFTPGLISTVCKRKGPNQAIDEDLLPDRSAVLGSNNTDNSDVGGYVDLDKNGHWWIPSGRVFYSSESNHAPPDELDYANQHFFLPHRYRDPFHMNKTSTETLVSYDLHDLLVVETCDALGNRVTAGERDAAGTITSPGNDYRVLQPRLVMDPNRNRTEVAFDALGMVVGTAVMGKPKPEPQRGDQLEDSFQVNLTQAEINDFLLDPRGQKAVSLLDSATTRIIYDLNSYWLEPDPKKKQPAFAATLARETHTSDPVPAGGLKIQVSFSYSDGFGREIQKKIQAEKGPVPERDPVKGLIITDASGQPKMIEGEFTRWVGSGWTIFNNKGKPVRQYEPFFTDRHQFEFDIKIGVSPVLFYDPVERVIATLHPNGTYEKVVFDPWHQKTYDMNDTVTFDPRTDKDISGYVAGYFKQEAPQPDDWKTWLVQRGIDPLNPPQDNSKLEPEKKAAIRTLIHADTPTTAFFDSLGRTFLTVAHNKFRRRKNGGFEVVDEKYRTRVKFDIEGNQREVSDERKKDRNLPDEQQNLEERIVMLYNYDMLSNRIYQFSMEAGERWMLNDVTGKPIRAWNSLANDLRTAYDPPRRPTEIYLKKPNLPEVLVEQTVYGEKQADAEAKNLRGKVYQVFDQAGVVTSTDYDFKGNLLQSSRQLAKEYKETLNWSAAPKLEDEIFTSSTTYDALNRPVQLTAPHSGKPNTKINLIRHIYNEANLLDRVEANLHGDEKVTTFVENIDYNAKGQRTKIVYGSGASHGNPNPADDREGVTTTYNYDPLTFRLTHLYTVRDKRSYSSDCPPPPQPGELPTQWPGCQLQNLHYTYDPAGNITCIRDEAQQTIFFKGKWVEPSAEYTYDAIYRLIEATGREHLGQAGWAPMPHSHDDYPRVGLVWAANDGDLMGTYLECFLYDVAGNILEVKHRGCDPSHPGWMRSYSYNEDSLIEPAIYQGGVLIEPGKKSNRLSSTTVGEDVDPYKHDLHGNMIYMPHLNNPNPANPDPNMHWDYKDQLHQVDTANNSPVYYAYDATGQRVRKVAEKSPGLTEEGIYLGGFEVFRQYNGNGAGDLELERETLHVMDDKQRIALVETRVHGNDKGMEHLIRYQFGNHLGSACLELDEMGERISYEEYYPYGSTSFQAVRTETPKRYRYTGKERDRESGFYYHGARYYSPWLGQWISPESNYEITSKFSRYQYCSSNPISFKDDNGEKDDWALDPNALSFAVPSPNWKPPPTPQTPWLEEKMSALKSQWKSGSTRDKIEMAATATGVASGIVPYAGDYVSMGSSGVALVAQPSWSNLANFGLDIVGALLPFVPALGTIRRAEKLAKEEKLVKEIQVLEKASTKVAKKEAKKAAPGLGEAMIKEEKSKKLNVDIAAQEHRHKLDFRQASGKEVESAHLVNSSSVRDIPGYLRDRAVTVLLPEKQHKAFDKYWKDWAREKWAKAKPGENMTATVAEWEKVLNEALESVPELRGRSADTLSFMIRHELYQNLGLKADQLLPVPKILRFPK